MGGVAFFPVGTVVHVESGEHTGKNGKVIAHFGTDGYENPSDVPHLIALDIPFIVPDGRPNPVNHMGQKIHGDAPFPDLVVTQIEVRASCLS